MGSTLVEIPYAFAVGLAFSVVFYPIVGVPSISTGLLYWISVSLFVLVETFLGQFLVYASPTLELATIAGVLINSFFLLFSGFNPPAASIPGVYKWCYYISPHRFVLSVLVALLFGDCSEELTPSTPFMTSDRPIGCHTLENAPLALGEITVKGYIDKVYNFKYEDIWTHFICTLCYIVALRVLALFSLRFLTYQKR
ncbi:hypothetical protein PF005_g15222 [Phytophthora fragariae]|uniref:ABC-2 type transporter transmembrane domain-containing protein n=2 Tax=Phytophthora TaxID=4783 RepID=A0A6A4CTH4_9STRA|nr:hypothetical protein PF009_g16302 [Phytophthora fragariae]KAE9336290.1 hypothetical protein PR003_g12578 [Phytophthora rubi]KAE8996968.1 hypothetical protein PF011_g15693 [Phytophthora fragariae]KAE9099803.1 hypothetical protein PF010_g15064 [Phytophthora fragariae]KAE9101406.1 hypothetical protein PF007_g15157 [Phytophthora fragariae]